MRTPFSMLSPSDQDVIRQAILAVLTSGIYSDRDFSNRCGVDKSSFQDALIRWPLLDDRGDDHDDTYVINGSLNEICNGLDFPKNLWGQWFTVSPPVVEEVYARWGQAQNDFAPAE